LLVGAAAAFGITALLINIFQHKQEAKNPYLRFVAVTPDTTDPEAWRKNCRDSTTATAAQSKLRGPTSVAATSIRSRRLVPSRG